LPLLKYRQELDAVVAEVFMKHKKLAFNVKRIYLEVENEQKDYLKRMELGEGIAANGALLENIFMLLVCILVKMPIFLVGKPGSSKTLAMKSVESNLRGHDSRDDWFKTLHEVKVVSYQGSVSSTSEGVTQAFKKAKSYAETSENATVVVLIDEVGLAEISPSNPLKVLHALLEDSDFEMNLDVAVVGISNWSLDAAKMNRAIHISRPEPGIPELNETSQKILESLFKPSLPSNTLLESIEHISGTYYEYFNNQLGNTEIANFHGLRDYYSCVKQIGAHRDNVNAEYLAFSIMRNFGGLPKTIQGTTSFDEFTGQLTLDQNVCGVKRLIIENLKDNNCRHLMLLTEGDAILNTLDSFFKDCKLASPRILIGSKLRGDQSENYHYRLLSEIIECMDTGVSLVLKDLDPIYGSLYDMLNQVFINYYNLILLNNSLYSLFLLVVHTCGW
jgi:nucleoside-triphosphatase THEP1